MTVLTVLSIADLQRGVSYLLSHPDYLLRSALNAARLRLGIPLDAVHWLLGKATRGKLPADLVLEAAPLGALRIAATVPVMGTLMALAAVISVEQVQLSADSVRVHLRVRDLSIKAPSDSPMAQMLLMMDLSKPGDLLSFLPVRPPLILDAHGDLFVLDLMKLPKLRKSALARRLVPALSEVLAIRELGTAGDLLVIGFRAMPLGLPAALGHLRG